MLCPIRKPGSEKNLNLTPLRRSTHLRTGVKISWYLPHDDDTGNSQIFCRLASGTYTPECSSSCGPFHWTYQSCCYEHMIEYARCSRLHLVTGKNRPLQSNSTCYKNSTRTQTHAEHTPSILNWSTSSHVATGTVRVREVNEALSCYWKEAQQRLLQNQYAYSKRMPSILKRTLSILKCMLSILDRDTSSHFDTRDSVLLLTVQFNAVSVWARTPV